MADTASFTSLYGERLRSLFPEVASTRVDKGAITTLSLLACEHPTKAADVVAAIEGRMRELNSGDARLPLFYLIDALVCNSAAQPCGFAKKFDPLITPMIQSAAKRASKKVQGSLYRMWNAWATKKTVFHAATLNKVETVLHTFLTRDERTEAINRASAATEPDPRKRAAVASTSAPVEQPIAKKTMLKDPRRAGASPPTAPSAELLMLQGILSSPDIASRVDLQPLVASIRQDMAGAAGLEAAQVKLIVAVAVNKLQTALLAAPLPTAQLMPPPLQPPPPMTFAPPPPMAMPSPFLPPPLPQPVPQVAAWAPPPPMPLPMPPPPMMANAPPRTARQMAQMETTITFSELDLKTSVEGGDVPHPWLADSLYTRIPFQCKTCGRRIHNQADMAAHLDFHFRMNKRAALIAKGGGSHSQNYYWEEWEWIQAPDVIFGVQTRTPALGKTAAGAGATQEDDSDIARLKRPPQNVVADENQKKCSVCHDAFKQEWSDEEESWLYPRCMRLTDEFLRDATAALTKLQAQPAVQVPQDGSAQAFAAQAKETERQTQLWRYGKIVKHVTTHAGQIVHQACHEGLLQSIMKSKPPTSSPAPSPSPTQSPTHSPAPSPIPSPTHTNESAQPEIQVKEDEPMPPSQALATNEPPPLE